MFAEPLLKTSRRRPNARYPHRSCRVWRPPCGESQRVTNESGSLGEGGGCRVGAFSSAVKQLVSNQRAQRRKQPHVRRQTTTLVRRGTCRNLRKLHIPGAESVPGWRKLFLHLLLHNSTTTTHPQASICFPPLSILETFPLTHRLFSSALFPCCGFCTRLLQIPLGYFHFLVSFSPLRPCLFMTVVLRGR